MKQLLVTILVLLTSIYSFAERDTLQVNTSNLCIEVYTMIPQRYSSRTVNDYSLCLKGDTVVCNLPYMGRAYSTSYSEQDAPLTFTLPTKNKEVQQKSGKKPKTTVSFTCHKATITYNFKIELLPKGSAYINIIPSNADGISFKGDYNTE